MALVSLSPVPFPSLRISLLDFFRRRNVLEWHSFETFVDALFRGLSIFVDVCTVYCIKYTPCTRAAYERTKAHVASKLNGQIEWEKRETKDERRKERRNGIKKGRTCRRGNEINFNLLKMAVCVLSYEHYTWFDLKFKCVTFCRHTVWIWYNFPQTHADGSAWKVQCFFCVAAIRSSVFCRWLVGIMDISYHVA